MKLYWIRRRLPDQVEERAETKINNNYENRN